MNIYHRIIMTAGTSALARPNAPNRWLAENAKELVTWHRERPVPRDVTVIDDLLRDWRDSLPDTPEPKSVSAEYSILYALRALGRLGPKPTVVLLSSDTVDGKLAAAMVGSLLERDFNAHVETRMVGDLDAEQPASMRRALGAFMNQVAVALEGGDPQTTCFAPLGGYKIMTSLAYVAGAFKRFPTVYLHETKQVLHEVPWVPIQIDRHELGRLASVVRRSMNGVAFSRLSEAERGDVETHPWLFERVEVDGDDFVLLNAFGHFLRSDARYRGLIGTSVLVDGASQKKLADGAVSRDVRAQVDALLRDLEDPVGKCDVLNHEVTFHISSREWHLYKGASGAAGVFRAVYRLDKETDALHLRKVWLEHKKYEAGAGREENYADCADDLVDVTLSLFAVEAD